MTTTISSLNSNNNNNNNSGSNAKEGVQQKLGNQMKQCKLEENESGPNGVGAAAAEAAAQTLANQSKLAQFYANKNILVTGATGFIGKVCIAKLVSSLGESGQVYVVLRPKKGLTSQQRLQKMLNEEPFKTVRRQQQQQQQQQQTVKTAAAAEEPQRQVVYEYNQKPLTREFAFGKLQLDWSKVVAVSGDMSCEDLGLDKEVKASLCKKVHIVFNIAASVQFDAPLKQNLRDNYSGARNLLKLATEFERLISLVHVSTFFTNFHKSHIEERVLPMQIDCEKMAEFIGWMPDEVCNKIEDKLLEMESRPNTYIFTKAMGENLVQKYEGRLPLAIVRPSIVTPSLRDPVPGWVDNVNGPMGLGVLASLGILRTIDWNYDGVSDFIPVDFVVNSMLAVAERTARLQQQGDREIKTYNCSSSSLNPQTWGNIFEVLRAESLQAPPFKMLRIPIKVPRYKRANKFVYTMTKLSELLFAYLVDFILMLCGQKQLLTRLTMRLHHGYEILKPFTTNEWTCSNENLIAAFEELDKQDKREFNFDVRQIDWRETFQDAYHGARERLLREDPANIPAAKLKMRVHYLVEYGFLAAFYAYCAYWMYKLW